MPIFFAYNFFYCEIIKKGDIEMMNLILFIKQVFNVYLFATFFIAGFYESVFEPKDLRKKGLEEDSKICRNIGLAYLLIDAIMYIIIKLLPI